MLPTKAVAAALATSPTMSALTSTSTSVKPAFEPANRSREPDLVAGMVVGEGVVGHRGRQADTKVTGRSRQLQTTT